MRGAHVLLWCFVVLLILGPPAFAQAEGSGGSGPDSWWSSFVHWWDNHRQAADSWWSWLRWWVTHPGGCDDDVVSVPEPSLLLLLGVAGGSVLVTRRKHAAAP